MKKWFMLTVVGTDRPRIVAELSNALFRGACNLGEASMVRLAGNFTIMLTVESEGDIESLRAIAGPVAERFGLRLHIDEIQARLHAHPEPNARITVFGADRAGIVAEVTGALADAGFNILDLSSDVGGTEAEPLYVMMIDGYSSEGWEALDRALAPMRQAGVDVRITRLETMIG